VEELWVEWGGGYEASVYLFIISFYMCFGRGGGLSEYCIVRAIQNVHEAEKICYMWLYIF